MKPPEEVVREVDEMQAKDRRRAVDLALNWSLDMLETGRTSEAETALRAVDVDASDLGVLVAWLTGTLQIADVSEERRAFFDRVRRRIEWEAPERAKGLLGGLGPSGAEGARWGHAMIVALTEGSGF